ncbi:MAG: hypothetical protein JWO69_88 [Thermoleophilia bacterium]|jgi:hypothetical protein|nr:hypothetical protein [Thermoleophilia bacterium]
MIETMLVRAAGGGWEELRPQTSMPDGGIVEVFGDDIGPVLAAGTPVLVAACEPMLSTGAPDAICVDAAGGVWIVQLALDGDGAATLPQLMGFGGSLTGMGYADFENVCARREGDTLARFVEQRAGGKGFDGAAFEAAVTDALAHGRVRLVAIVREAAPALVHSMRFLNASGAMGALFEATSYASSSVSAVRATAVDLSGAGNASMPAVAAAPSAPTPAPAPEATPVNADIGAFIAATAAATDERTSVLMGQLQQACAASFAAVRVDGSGEDAELHVMIDSSDEDAAIIVASTDGAIVVSFEALGALDPGWTVRAELCQGMERLLGADLGDVRKISQLNLSIAEHLMDATLMEALTELLADTAQALHGDGSDGARIGAREPAAA